MAVQRQVGSMTNAKPSISDLTGKEFRFCKDVAGGVDLCGNGQQPAGVISEGKPIGQHTSYNTGNQLKVLAGTTINPGAKVASGANGVAEAASTGDYVYGRCISEAAVAADELAEIEVTNEGVLAA